MTLNVTLNHCRKFVKILGANSNFWETKGGKNSLIRGLSQLLGPRARAAPQSLRLCLKRPSRRLT